MVMADRINEAFDSKLATKAVLGGIAAGVAFLGYLLYGGWNKIDETSISQKLMAQQVGTLVETVNDLKARIESGSADRYTGANAASDRSAFLSSFTAAIQAQSAAFGDMLSGTNDRLQAISIRQTEFDRSLKELLSFQSRMEERIKLEDRKP